MSTQEDKVYAEVGRNWAGMLEFAKSLGFELDTVQFKHTDGNVVTMSFKELQGARGISLLRVLLSGARAVPVTKTCIRCRGKGYFATIEDCHNSAGIIPCPDCKVNK